MRRGYFLNVSPASKFLMILMLVAMIAAQPAHAINAFKAKTDKVAGQVAGQQEEVAVEVTAVEATSDKELKESVQWAERELKNAVKQNPALQPEIVLADADAKGEPAVSQGGQTLNTKPTLSKLHEWIQKYYRVTFTLVRGVSNAGVVSAGLIVSSHVTLESAVPVGLIAGGMSAGFMYYNQAYQSWLMKTKNPTMRLLGKSYAANIVYMAITKFTAAVSGVPGDPTLWLATASILKTAFVGTLAQGTWGLAVAENARVAIERYPTQEARIRLLNDFKTLGLSVASTALSVASMVGAPLTDAAMVAMAATGIAYYKFSLVKGRKWDNEKLAREAEALSCRNKLTHQFFR